ncbi:family 43 glycosylhydrolase [Christiangramia crocea]|uniref:Family 43 glycosylhydrolase n=1 Tax=Christiangramia crocea TaxID=2904124 RepID=A0A9X2A3T8_9FLAO|nr:family 43 glycosylhydrolase [Gramella crocea]MCG9970005.1 family 43 glycosylhydrolase [Gramella crocea]
MDYKRLLVIVIILFQCNLFFSQEEVLPVWPDKIPGAISAKNYQEQPVMRNGVLTGTSKVTQPEISVFSPENPNGTAVLILPGGGYGHLAIEKEGFKVARWLKSLGVTGFVLKYRMPSDEIMENKAIGPLQDAQEAMRIIRGNAEKWNLDKEKIGVMGFSAGGHLAATLSTKFDLETYEADKISARPAFSALIYPVISMNKDITHMGSRNNLLGEKASDEQINTFSNELNVSSETPPVFLAHATDDQAVPVENSIQYFLSAKDNKVPAELHIYEKGGHGFGLGTMAPNDEWPQTFKSWMQVHKLVEQDSVFVFSYFKGNGEDGLHLAYSKNGLNWKALNNDKSYLKPQLGNEKLMRDPCIIKGGDGRYHMVWTVGWTEKGIGYASSEDLINWSEQQYIPVMEHEEKARNCWAPELTYDHVNDEYMIYWATTIRGEFPETQIEADDGYNHRMYYTTTKDFKNFSPTKLLFDPGFNIIDASLIKANGQYYMFLKDETREPEQKNIRTATAQKIAGPYKNVSKPITGDYWAEGPTAAKIGDYWYVFFDKYTEKKYGAVRSSDLKTWEDVSKTISFPNGIRHGSILKVSEETLDRLNE